MLTPEDIENVLIGITFLATASTGLSYVIYRDYKSGWSRLQKEGYIKEIPESLRTFRAYLRDLTNGFSD